MSEPVLGFETVVRTRHRNECQELRLVLDAVGIPAEALFRDGWWLVIVDQNQLDTAVSELDDYRRENPVRSLQRRQAVPVYGGAATAVFVYAAIILLFFALTVVGAFGLDWRWTGRMQAGRVVSGEWWRVVTALTLHQDSGHILANLGFGSVFGFLAGRIFGGGVAWLAIVVAGALGNFVNALVQAPSHSSIGASTAVFAALGLIVAHALCHRGSEPERPLRRWSPLIAGVLLLAYTGVGGERTDVVAHLTGFLSGLLIGFLGCRLSDDSLASGVVQKWAGLAAIVLVAIAWIVAASQ